MRVMQGMQAKCFLSAKEGGAHLAKVQSQEVRSQEGDCGVGTSLGLRWSTFPYGRESKGR